MLKVLRFSEILQLYLSNVATLPTFSVANVAGPSTYRGCRGFSVAEFCGGLKNGGSYYCVFEVLGVFRVFSGCGNRKSLVLRCLAPGSLGT